MEISSLVGLITYDADNTFSDIEILKRFTVCISIGEVHIYQYMKP
jgi:hypothetical protein